MNATTYAYLPPSLNVNRSLCHIWLGVARSKKRGRVRLRRAFGGRSINPASCKRRRTVSGLAGRKNSRRSVLAIRFTPYQRFARFSWMIFSVMAAGRRRPGRGAACPCSPASPLAR